jgi:WD40 repeat protein
MDKTARIWDAATGKPCSSSLEHREQVRSATFSPDGTRILTTSADKAADIWEFPLDQGTLAQWSAIAERSPYMLIDNVLSLRPLRVSARAGD